MRQAKRACDSTSKKVRTTALSRSEYHCVAIPLAVRRIQLKKHLSIRLSAFSWQYVSVWNRSKIIRIIHLVYSDTENAMFSLSLYSFRDLSFIPKLLQISSRLFKSLYILQSLRISSVSFSVNPKGFKILY